MNKIGELEHLLNNLPHVPQFDCLVFASSVHELSLLLKADRERVLNRALDIEKRLVVV
jgi:hypothetical protein